MKKLRLLAGLYAALAAMTGCVVEVNFEPIGGDVSVEGAWTINGGPASTASCSAAGIQTVRLQICEFVDGDCYTASNLEAACSAGGFTTSPFLVAGTYALRWQGIRSDGSVDNRPWSEVTVLSGDRIETTANFDVTLPDEDTLAGTWTVGGQPANATSCAAAGIMNVRLAFHTNDQGTALFRETLFPCSAGSFDSRSGMGPTLPDGMFYSQWQALDAAGAVIATSELPLLELDTSAVTHATLAPVDFPAGEPMLVINIRYQLLGGAEDGTCDEAMMQDSGYMFLLRTSTGSLVSLSPPITACVNQVELPGLPADTYSLEIAGMATDGTKYGTTCGGLAYESGVTMYDCFVDIVP